MLMFSSSRNLSTQPQRWERHFYPHYQKSPWKPNVIFNLQSMEEFFDKTPEEPQKPKILEEGYLIFFDFFTLKGTQA